MGNSFSNDNTRKTSDIEPINETQNLEQPIQKVDAPAKKCSTEHACQIEDQDIKGLAELKTLEEQLDKVIPLSSDIFDELWDSIHENGASFIETESVPKFSAERDQVIIAFQGTDFEKKQEAGKQFKEAVDRELKRIAKKNSKEGTEEVDQVS